MKTKRKLQTPAIAFLFLLSVLQATANQSPHATGGYQKRADTGAAIAEGGTVPQGVGINIGATVTDPDVGDTIRIEVELHQLPATFTGTANYVSSYVSSGSVASLSTITGLSTGNYGWQYRAVDNHGLATGWVAAGNPDFIVQGATPILSVSPLNPATQPATAGSINLSVNNTGSGTMSYSASVTSGSSWLSITSGGSGGNSGTIVTSYTANNTGVQRSGTIQVTASGASGSPATVTVTQAATTTSSSPLFGKGDWIHKISSAIAAVPGATTIQDLINYEQSIGVKYLIVKAGEGDYYYPASGMKLDTAFVSACHAAGIKVFGFHYVYGGAYQGRVLSNGQPDPNFYNENSSVNTEVSVAIQILDTGCDGLVIDGESAYEDFAPGAVITPGDGDPTRFYYPGTLPPSPSLSPVAAQSAATAAQAYCSGILNARPTAFLAHAPFFNPSSHSYFPYLTFGKYCAAVLPQAYYWFNGLSPESTVAAMDSQWKTLQNSWISSGHADSVKPLFPIGYSAPPYASGADITDFVNLLNNDASPATTGGYQGVSFWDADLQSSSTWSAIASATIGSTPNPDTTPPTISAFSVTPSSIPVGSSFTASYTVSDSGGSELKQVVLRRTSGDGSANDPGWQDIQTVTVTGNGPVSGSFNPDTPPSAGIYWYGMAAFDNANNSKDERASGFGPVQRSVTTPTDTTPPTVLISSPTSGQPFTASPVSVSGTATDPGSPSTGVSLVQVQVNGTGGTWQTASGTTSWNASVSLSSGDNTIYVRSQDGAGNYSTIASVNVTYNPPDTTPPTLSITSPLNGATVTSASLPISGTATDNGNGNSGISSVTVNGIAASSDTASGANTANWNTTIALNSGANTVTVIATDGAGNTTQQQISITYNPPDTTPPTLTIASPVNNATVTSASLSVNGTATDNGNGNNGVSSVTVNSIAANNDTTNGSGTANWSTTIALHSGPNTITVVAKDTLSNPTSQQINVTYNPPRPIFGGLSVSGGQLQATVSGLSTQETVVFSVSTDLKNWTPVQTIIASGSTYPFTYPINPAMQGQYFRATVQ